MASGLWAITRWEPQAPGLGLVGGCPSPQARPPGSLPGTLQMGALAFRSRGMAGWDGMLVSKLPCHRVTLSCLNLKVLGVQLLFFQ